MRGVRRCWMRDLSCIWNQSKATKWTRNLESFVTFCLPKNGSNSWCLRKMYRTDICFIDLSSSYKIDSKVQIKKVNGQNTFSHLSHDGTFLYFMIVTAMPSWVPVPLKTLSNVSQIPFFIRRSYVSIDLRNVLLFTLQLTLDLNSQVSYFWAALINLRKDT